MHDVWNLCPGQTHLPRRGAPDALALEWHLLDRTPATEIGQRGQLGYEGPPWPWHGLLLPGDLCRGGFLPGSRRDRHEASPYIPPSDWWHRLGSLTRTSPHILGHDAPSRTTPWDSLEVNT
jgi:hypothetical protein